MRTPPTRRAVLGAAVATAGSAVLAACSGESDTGRGGKKTGSANAGGTSHGGTEHGASPGGRSEGEHVSPGGRSEGKYVSPGGKEVAAAEAARGSGPVRKVDLVATPSRLDLGDGLIVGSWAYGARLPGKELRVTMGDTLALNLANHLPEETSLHWHGLNVRNDMDGVPDVTQAPIKPGAEFAYRFTVPHAGTYWFHPHTGVQQDRGLYAPLIVEDPREPLKYDREWVVVLDDWVDGVAGSTPDSVLYELSHGKGGMHHGSANGSGGHGSPAKPAKPKGRTGPTRLAEGSYSELLDSHGGDVAYPYYLINGRTPKAPTSFAAKPGDRIRLRIINAGGDTAFRVALGGHRMTITHTDGYPVRHRTTDALLLGMGERYDVVVTAGDGVFPLTALAEGKNATALALLRTGKGTAPTASVRPRELDGELVEAYGLWPDPSMELSRRKPDRIHRFKLTGNMRAYNWAFDHTPYDPHQRHPVWAGERVRLEFYNATEMWHPIHLHGHSFGVVGPAGRRHEATERGRAEWARKDTAIVRPNSSLAVEFDANNPGLWMLHCHNIYHSDVGMMTVLGYRH
ncbi:multicopper oxidase domain-containing protein [Streptomyces sp. NPDC047917]|uniref:multicopper oxidase domain-containing protein n=1 Tax=Streptomyces sp. NPDC047917 TaxID=3365491 RepID=UPI00370FE641